MAQSVPSDDAQNRTVFSPFPTLSKHTTKMVLLVDYNRPRHYDYIINGNKACRIIIPNSSFCIKLSGSAAYLQTTPTYGKLNGNKII